MANAAAQALSAQMNADPRVRQWVTSHFPRGTRGAAEVPADVLRSWGYQIPEGHRVSVQGNRVSVYDTFDKWDAIIPGAAAGLGGYAAFSGALSPAAAGQGGAASQSASGVLPSASIPNAHLMTPAAIGSQNISAGVGPLSGLSFPGTPSYWDAIGQPPDGTLASRPISGVSRAPTTPGSQGVSQSVRPGGMLPNGRGTPGAASLADSAKDFFTNPKDLAGLAGVIMALAGGSGGSANSEGAERLNRLTEQRMRRVDPLHQAVTQLAWGRLPISARQGVTPPAYQPLED